MDDNFQPTGTEWIRMADGALHLMLEKLAISATKVLVERMNGSEEYISIDDSNMLSLIRSVTSNDDGLFVTNIKEVTVKDAEHMRVNFKQDYSFNEREATVYELESKIGIISNPTRSALVDDMMIDSEMVKTKLDRLGYKCSLLVKKNDKTYKGRLSKKARFKPRQNLSVSTKNKAKKNAIWIPDVVRSANSESNELPAVLIG